MDAINNLIFSALNNTGIPQISSGFIGLPQELVSPTTPGIINGLNSSYHIKIKEVFCTFDDSDYIDKAIQKHWTDMVYKRDYKNGSVVYTAFTDIPNPLTATQTDRDNQGVHLIPLYHLIYAYLVENTRIAQIFEKMLHMYTHDEKLTKATTSQNKSAFQWIMNTESLFYSNLSNTNYRNLKTQVRYHPEMTRRNAYWRLFGMDLAFGDLQSNTPVNYFKAEFNNQPFIVLFEKFLTEIWQAYANANNSSGPNTTDMFTIVDAAQKIQEMLMSRRTTETNFNNYRYFNLSKEEYSSVVMMSWFYEVISYDSPLIQFLRCNGGTPGERLINIGKKVGVPAHSKSEGLLDIAPPMNTLLRRIELGDYNVETTVTNIIKSQLNNLPINSPERMALNDLLQIINNWEKATGHKIKNPEANIKGTVRIQPQKVNGVNSNGIGVKPQQVIN